MVSWCCCSGRVAGWCLGARVGLSARPASVCWLLLFERAKSMLNGSVMCEVEGGVQR